MRFPGSRPRVAVFTRPLDNWISGSGRHLQEILNATLDLNEDRFDFTFVHYAPSSNPIYRRNVRELLVPRNPLRSAAILRRERFDIVHYSPLTIYSPLWGVPGLKVATIHGAEQLLQPQLVGPLELAHESLLVPAYARRMDRVVTVSRASAGLLVDRFGVSPDRIEICANGLSSGFRVISGELSAPARLGIRLPYILHVSRFSERKNPWVMLEAFARLVKRQRLRHTLVCAGTGWSSEGIRRKVRSLGIEDRYCAPGFVATEDLSELMNGAELFVFPSLAEGFGMPTIEAMACACPVVTTQGFAVREVVADAAVVVDDATDAAALSEGMLRVLTDKELRARLIGNGLRRAQLYSWPRSAQRLLALYHDLLKSWRSDASTVA